MANQTTAGIKWISGTNQIHTVTASAGGVAQAAAIVSAINSLRDKFKLMLATKIAGTGYVNYAEADPSAAGFLTVTDNLPASDLVINLVRFGGLLGDSGVVIDNAIVRIKNANVIYQLPGFAGMADGTHASIKAVADEYTDSNGNKGWKVLNAYYVI
jgi:hypothetical protein